MSRYTYAGPFTNPTTNFMVLPNPQGDGYIIGVRQFCECGAACCSRPELEPRPHTEGRVFEEAEDAGDWIESTAEFFERDYEDYLEENSHSIRQMELYEQFKNEY